MALRQIDVDSVRANEINWLPRREAGSWFNLTPLPRERGISSLQVCPAAYYVPLVCYTEPGVSKRFVYQLGETEEVP